MLSQHLFVIIEDNMSPTWVCVLKVDEQDVIPVSIKSQLALNSIASGELNVISTCLVSVRNSYITKSEYSEDRFD